MQLTQLTQATQRSKRKHKSDDYFCVTALRNVAYFALCPLRVKPMES